MDYSKKKPKQNRGKLIVKSKKNIESTGSNEIESDSLEALIKYFEVLIEVDNG